MKKIKPEAPVTRIFLVTLYCVTTTSSLCHLLGYYGMFINDFRLMQIVVGVINSSGVKYF